MATYLKKNLKTMMKCVVLYLFNKFRVHKLSASVPLKNGKQILTFASEKDEMLVMKPLKECWQVEICVL